MSGWIGVDLDGTLAVYDGWKGIDHIGEPVPAMLERVKGWIAEGREVRIVTARVGAIWQANPLAGHVEEAHAAMEVIKAWTLKHVGLELYVTALKDFGMVELWDDRAKQVIPNTGVAIEELVDWPALKTDPPASEPA